MRIDIISTLPKVFDSVISTGMIRIAVERGIAEIVLHNLHDYSSDKFGHVDDTPYGGGAGMIIKCEPVFKIVEMLKSQRNYDEIVYLTADGNLLNQALSNRLSLSDNLIMICGRYKGIDQRIRDELVTLEVSIGDYVLSGGELPACVLLDSIVRLVPGVLGDAEAALEDSFQNGLLEPPYYTKPADFRGMRVPEVLQSGNHSAIKEWRDKMALKKTRSRRSDLLDN